MAFSWNEDRELLLSRSQDLEFTDDVTGFQCNRCDRVLIRHYISNCGHKFCLNCKKILDDGSSEWRCPIEECNRFIEHINLQDFNFEQKVFELRTHCPNHKYGCSYVGQLKDVGGHLRMCKDTRENALPVLLPENNRLDDVFKQMSKFHETFEMMSLRLNEIKEEMREERLVRERKCEEMDSRVHRMEGETLKLKGKYETLFQILEVKENKFEESKIQLKLEMKGLTDEIWELKKKLKTDEKSKGAETPLTAQEIHDDLMRPEIQQFRIVSDYYKEKPDFTWIVTSAKTFLNGNESEGLSEVFSLNGYPFKAQMKMTIKAKSVNFSLCFKNKSNTKTKLAINANPKIYITFKDQSKEKERGDLIISSDFRYTFMYNEFYSLYSANVIESILASSTYNVDDKVVVEIHVEAPQMAYSYDGTLTWAIDNYMKRKRMQKDGSIDCYLSPYFYTSPKGNRVQVKMHLNEGLNVEIQYLNGLYDEINYKVLNHRVTVTIFHPTKPPQNISKITTDAGYGYHNGCTIDMGVIDEIEDLLYNDTLYYKVTVEIFNI